MKIQIEQSVLSKHLDNAAKFLPKKDVIPILSHIILSANSSGLEIVAGNSETFLKPVINSENLVIIESGSAAIPGKELSEIVKKLSGLITIETRKREVVLHTDKSEYELDVLDHEEYPPFPIVNESSIRMKGKDFKELIATTTYATSTNEATPILTGTLFAQRDGSLRIVSCDRHRLARIDFENEGENFQTVLHGSVLVELAKILGDDELEISFHNALLVKSNEFTFYSRILDGSYPETERLIPTSFSTEMTVNKRDITEALERVLIVAKENKSNLVKLNLSKDGIVIESKEQKKRAKETVDVKKYIGNALTVNCNGKYLADALKAIGTMEIELCLNDQMEPIIVRGKDELSLHLILPYRT
ncbi:DNA polymerase III subunit beta [Paenibacillus sp. 2RAB27]|uniref:DNA polymerase III subunit beta n=1 Tax=Paenibacillus sp. 2RAB27 TaxID=3232991 RepID=UPI003F9DBA0B